jgi:hypothetical protein
MVSSTLQILDHSTLNRLEFSRPFLTAHETARIFKFSLFVPIRSFFYVNIRLIIITTLMKVT